LLLPRLVRRALCDARRAPRSVLQPDKEPRLRFRAELAYRAKHRSCAALLR
jgi:hypothetical protein